MDDCSFEVEFSPGSIDTSISGTLSSDSQATEEKSHTVVFGASQDRNKKQSSLSDYYGKKSSTLKKRKVSFNDDIEIITVIPTNKDKVVSEKNINDFTDEELLTLHFGESLTPHSVARWCFEPDWINQVSKCPIDENDTCNICTKLFFSIRLRGYPSMSEAWFNDAAWDSTNEYYRNSRSGHGDIIDKFTRNCLPKEKFLRNISRKDVYEALMLRFRGHYSGSDCIDFIMNSGNWENFGGYLQWKDKWDELFKEEWVNCLKNNLYCTGCGLRAQTKYKYYYPDERYQICSLGYCNFYHDEQKCYAVVKKDNDFEKDAVYK